MSKRTSTKQPHRSRSLIKGRLASLGYVCLIDIARALELDYGKLRLAAVYNPNGPHPHVFRYAGMWFIHRARIPEMLRMLHEPLRREALKRWERYMRAVLSKNTD